MFYGGVNNVVCWRPVNKKSRMCFRLAQGCRKRRPKHKVVWEKNNSSLNSAPEAGRASATVTRVPPPPPPPRRGKSPPPPPLSPPPPPPSTLVHIMTFYNNN